MAKELLNRFINLLSEKDYPIPNAIIYYVIPDEEFHTEIATEELSRFNIIKTSSDSSGGITYYLTESAKNEIKSIPEEFKNDPYGYFLNKEKIQKEETDFATKLSVEQLVLNVNKLRDEMKELSETKRLAKNAKLWSIGASVATALTLILLLMQWICNKKP